MFRGGRTELTGGVNEGGVPQLFGADEHTGAALTITTPHRAIHAGDHYTASDVALDVDIATPKYWHVKVPAQSSSSGAECAELEYHATLGIQASAGVLVEVFKDADVSADGTPVPFCNNNDNLPDETMMEAFADPTVSDDGERIGVTVVGGGANPASAAPGSERADAERVMKFGSSYLVKVTAIIDDTLVSFAVGMYEVCEDAQSVVIS